MQKAIVRKYKDGELMKVEQLVKHKGKYVKPTSIVRPTRSTVNFSFFSNALRKMSPNEQSKAMEFLKSI